MSAILRGPPRIELMLSATPHLIVAFACQLYLADELPSMCMHYWLNSAAVIDSSECQIIVAGSFTDLLWADGWIDET